MIYVVVATKSEAQGVAEHLKLIKSKLYGYTTFTSDELVVLVSGVGIEAMSKATKTLMNDIKQDDTLVNIGICASNHKVGTVFEISKIIYKDIIYELNKNSTLSIRCEDFEATKKSHDIVDMESFGFYIASNAHKNRFIYKVVSDNFEPQKVTKDETKKLIKRLIDESSCC